MHTYKKKFRAAAINMQNTHTYTSSTYNSGSVEPSMLQTSIQLSLDLPERDTARPYHRQEIPGSAPGEIIERGRDVCPAPTAAKKLYNNILMAPSWMAQ